MIAICQPLRAYTSVPDTNPTLSVLSPSESFADCADSAFVKWPRLRAGKHKKKCPKTFVHETAQQREKRLKQEERWRDQELGSEYVDVEKQTEKTFTEYVPSRCCSP